MFLWLGLRSDPCKESPYATQSMYRMDGRSLAHPPIRSQSSWRKRLLQNVQVPSKRINFEDVSNSGSQSFHCFPAVFLFCAFHELRLQQFQRQVWNWPHRCGQRLHQDHERPVDYRGHTALRQQLLCLAGSARALPSAPVGIQSHPTVPGWGMRKA